MSDVLLTLLGMNLFAAAAVLLVVVLRLPARRLFGARIAYSLWSLPPLAALALLLPARVVTVEVPSLPQTVAPVIADAAPVAVAAGPDLWLIAAGLWIAGVLANLAYLAWRQVQFGRAVREGLAGPAVIGVLRPRIVTPDDFDRRYTPRERQVVLAHERAHIARHDSRTNALVALARCVNWFNPAIHLCAHLLRIDQELACDAQVVAAHPTARRSYAEAMLKTQLAVRPLPLGCYWPAQAAHPLAQRISLLSRNTPGLAGRLAGTAAVAALGLAAAGAAWAARPAHVVTVAVAAPAATPAPHTPEAAHPKSKVSARPRTAPAPAPTSARAEQEARTDAMYAVVAVAAPLAAALPVSPPHPPAGTVARRSRVEPGSAVRVVANAIDPDGVPLFADFTSFGSQRDLRKGTYQRAGSKYGLYTSVMQRGDRLWITASLNQRFESPAVGTAVLASGQTGQITLGNGQMITVTPTIRPETPDEIARGERVSRGAERQRLQRASYIRPDRREPIY